MTDEREPLERDQLERERREAEQHAPRATRRNKQAAMIASCKTPAGGAVPDAANARARTIACSLPMCRPISLPVPRMKVARRAFRETLPGKQRLWRRRVGEAKRAGRRVRRRAKVVDQLVACHELPTWPWIEVVSIRVLTAHAAWRTLAHMGIELALKPGITIREEGTSLSAVSERGVVTFPREMMFILMHLTRTPQLFDEFEFEHLPPVIADAIRINDHVFSTSARPAPAQFARMIVKPNSRQLVFLFTGIGFGLMGPAERFLAEARLLERNTVVFRDASLNCYVKGIADHIRSLPELASWMDGFRTAHAIELRDSYSLGVSMGSFPAMVTGHLLGLPVVHALAPMHVVPVTSQNALEPAWALPNVLREHNGVTEYRVYFNEAHPRAHEVAQELAKLPGVVLVPQAGQGHDIVTPLIESGLLGRMFPEPEPRRCRADGVRRPRPTRDEIAKFLRDVLRAPVDLDKGRVALDSLAIIQFAGFLEGRYGITFPANRITMLVDGSFGELMAVLDAASNESHITINANRSAHPERSVAHPDALAPSMRVMHTGAITVAAAEPVVERHTARSVSITGGPSLARVILASAKRHPDRVALQVGSTTLTYRAIADRAGRIARFIGEYQAPGPKLGAVWGARSVTAYSGVLGTLIGGAGYVPLNPRFPDARTIKMLDASHAASLVAEARDADRLNGMLAGVAHPLLVILPEVEDCSPFAAQHRRHRFIGARDLEGVVPRTEPVPVDPNSIAYLMFTSGSTGDPNGVMVTHANVLHHLDVMWERYGITEHDRFSQTFDLTFDLSVFDMFVSWGRGASLHCPSYGELMNPSKFIQEHELTVWFSVPSLAILMKQLRLLEPAVYPTLRWSLFCGERLPMGVAEAWSLAAPGSIVENLYGPTEATIACTLYRWDPDRSPSECVDGVVPIGVPYDGMMAAIVDDALGHVKAGERGELCMRGPQLAAGYWQMPDKTAERYVAMPWDHGPENRWYRTGDLAYLDPRGQIIHCGRSDDQVKVRGFRVELAEIEHVLRECAETDFVAAVPIVVDGTNVASIVGFIAGSHHPAETVLHAVARRLPEYMVPREIIALAALPLSSNGKIDRGQLRTLPKR